MSTLLESAHAQQSVVSSVAPEEIELLSRALHRSRNFLMSIRGYAELIEKGEGGPVRQSDWARRIVVQLEGLDHLYERMAELGQRNGRIGSVSMALVLRAATQRLRDRGGQVATRVRMEIEADPFVRANAEELTIAVLAVLQNACEASRLHRPVLVRLESESSTGWVLRVVDCGPGLDAPHAERIGEPFFSRKTGHVGLGVFTSRTLLARHGLELSLADRPEGGVEAVIRQRQQPPGGDR